MTIITRIKSGVVGLLLVGSGAFAALNPTAKVLQIEKVDDALWQGQPTRFMVVALGDAPLDGRLALPATDDFIMTAGTPVKLTQGDQPGVGYPVQLTPLKSGDLTLPPFALQGHSDYQSEAWALSVLAPAFSDDIRINVKRSADDIYLGQSIRLKFEWVTRLHPRALKAVNILIPEMEQAAIRTLEPGVDESVLQNKPIGLPVGQRRVTGRWEKLENQEVRISFDYVLQPTQAGQFEFPQPVLLASVDTQSLSYRRGEFKGMRYPPHFDNNFFDEVRRTGKKENQHPVKRIMAVADAYQVNVRPLPAGAPKHFTGIVGRPEVKVQTEDKRVNQGDAVKVAFHVTHPDLEIFSLPNLKDNEAFSHGFDMPVAADPVRYQGEEKVIGQTIFPDRPDIHEIPPLIISYFDPESQEYRDYITPPVPLEVIPAKSFDFSNSELPGGVRLISQVIASDQGIWSHLWGRSLLIEHSMNHRWWPLALILFLLIPPLLVLVKLRPMLFNAWQRRGRRTPLGQFKYQLKAGAEPLTLLGLYFSRRVGLSPGQFNPTRIQSQLSHWQVLSETVQQLVDWLEQHQRQFTKEGAELSPDFRGELIEIVTRIDQQLPEQAEVETTGVLV